jgi:hypothetical protein
MTSTELLEELKTITESDVAPFPYEGCRKLQQFAPEISGEIIPDLDVYLSELAGYRSWGKRILGWPDEKIENVQRRLQQSFLDRYPAYARLEAQIAAADDVRRKLEIAEQTRSVLSKLLAKVRAERVAAPH